MTPHWVVTFAMSYKLWMSETKLSQKVSGMPRLQQCKYPTKRRNRRYINVLLLAFDTHIKGESKTYLPCFSSCAYVV